MKRQRLFLIIYLFIYLAAGTAMVLSQPCGNPPDEFSRFSIPLYIARNLKIPTGAEPELYISSFGFSYASRPILPYMIQAVFVKLAMLFGLPDENLFYAARFTNLLSGLFMAILVFKLGRKWFSDVRIAGLFSCLITFLPQALFLHTYVNTESCCMLSIVMILYALQSGFEDSFSIKNCFLLSAGIILCLLSYYNAYAYILSAVILFFAYYGLVEKPESFVKNKTMWKKALFVTLLVTAGAAWWFVRNGILRNGDFLALKELQTLVGDDSFAFVGYREITGKSVLQMLTESDFITLSMLTFIGAFGATDIISTLFLYGFYKRVFFYGLLSQIIFCFAKSKKSFANHSRFRVVWHLNMIFCIFMPVVLSIYYSYCSDYEPQGRYLLPALLPLVYYSVAGIEKALQFCESLLRKRQPKENAEISEKRTGTGVFQKTMFTTLVTSLLDIITGLLLFITVFGYALPAYAELK